MTYFTRLLTILAVAVALANQPAFAEEEELLTAGELLNSCNDGYSPGSPTAFCMKYVGDFVFMMMAIQQAEQSPPVFCINPQLHALPDVTEKVHSYLRANTSRSNDAAQDLVVEALNKGYPCSLSNQT
ncbi:MAG: Rap1a/Tai family immunity protein [Gammaproteobacteria bacterium]